MDTLLTDRKVRDFWLNELQLPLSGFDIYTDSPKVNYEGDSATSTHRLVLPEDALSRISKDRDLESWMLTCYYVFLFRMSGETDQIVGVKNSAGDLLPLRLNCDGKTSFRDLYRVVRDKRAAMNDVYMPLKDIEEMIGHSPVFYTVFGTKPGADGAALRGESAGSAYLHWQFAWLNGGGELRIGYERHLFKAGTIAKFAAHFEWIVRAVLENEEQAIGAIPILTADDKLAYAELNDTAKVWPSLPVSIPGMLRSTVRLHGDRVALSSGDRRLTYRELDCVSNRLARMLLQRGLQKGQFVAIFMERSLDAVIAMLAVLKAGGAYIPLDPEHPEDRNAYIIADTRTGIVLTKEGYASQLETLLTAADREVSTLYLDRQLDEDDAELDPAYLTSGDDVAYIIYTSGTTGRPKGVLIPHAGILNLAMATVEQLGLREEDVILQYSTFSFDASVYDIYSAICCGARLHLLSNEQRYSVEAFTAAIEEMSATRIGILPTVFFNQLSAYLSAEEALKYGRIRSFVIGGEALPGESVRSLQRKLPHLPVIVNAYGPTEVTVATTTHLMDSPVPEHLNTISIGKPLANYEVLIVNELLQPCPVNVAGELLIHSVGLAKGYLNQPEKTGEAFISDPVNPGSDKRYYRSGDLVRLQQDGGIEYVGRKDLQVKIRGYRIEIGEIEENLIKHEALKDAAVIVKEDEAGEKELVAFYTSKNEMPVEKAELVAFMKSKVPAYMVPSHFIWLEAMPVSPTGKIDRRKLGLHELPEEEGNGGADAAPPENELQAEIAAAWAKALRLRAVGIHDDFFEIGGHSLKILETLVLLKPRFPQLKINDFFAYPTVARLAERVTELAQAAASGKGAAAPGLTGETVDLAETPRQFGPGSLTGGSPIRQHHILLTGATGYLGSSLLHELLRTSKTTVYCLIRPMHGQDAYERLQRVMEGYFGSDGVSRMEGRVVAVQGDLEQPDLGLVGPVRELLLARIDSIIHCGAEVKHFGEAEYFHRVNVESTDRLLALARGREVRFHYVSTLGIPEDLAMAGQWETFISEDGYRDPSLDTGNVYTNSKLAAERLVVRACEEQGVPATVYRVGNLSCHSETGAFQRNIDNNAFYRMLKSMLLLGKAPSVSWQVDLTPVNFASGAIAALALQERTPGRLFHICNPVQLPYAEMVDSFRALGYRIELLDWAEYESWLLDATRPKDQAGLELAIAQLEGDGAKNSPFRFACPQTVEYLEGTGITCHVPDSEYIKRLVQYATGVGYFPKSS
ncbi:MULTISPECIES: amino acid adenylation domain-containing protein [Paenibacillus]|uniref:non-ribosomal peptide synthetase family protein n=1 Tax=Paenibacillus TaxID=44249 RepID=UPI002FDF398B